MSKKLARLTFVLMFAATGILIQANPASANNDPHRSFAAASPFDLPASYCGFAVHFAFPVDKEYSTITVTSDGSTVIKTSGSLFVVLTNNATGNSITVNASGPGTVTIAPDGTNAAVEAEGLGVLFASNGIQVGLVSNLVFTSGPLRFTENLALNTITSLSSTPHVLLDLCAALS
jgi:hypothetical protein